MWSPYQRTFLPSPLCSSKFYRPTECSIPTDNNNKQMFCSCPKITQDFQSKKEKKWSLSWYKFVAKYDSLSKGKEKILKFSYQKIHFSP